jgi:hypothetical protein
VKDVGVAGDVELGPSHFVSALTGPNNDNDYLYLGCIFDGRRYAHSRKSRIAADAPSAVAFDWVWRTLTVGQMHPELAVWHGIRAAYVVVDSRLRRASRAAGPVCAGRV